VTSQTASRGAGTVLMTGTPVRRRILELLHEGPTPVGRGVMTAGARPG